MKKLSLPFLFLIVASGAAAQTTPACAAPRGFFDRWAVRTSAIQSRQPAWAVPLVTTYTGLFQVARTDILRQTTPALTHTWNLDNGKGLNIIPWNRTELDFNLPPFIKHNSTVADGFGDISFLGKFRIASGNAQHGTYALSVWVLATVPTGSHKNGSASASVAPTLGAGKGFGRFDVQSTIGATLPTGNTATTATGRPIAWNTVAQYHAGKLFWPEIESNATYYKGGANDGKAQVFITPGLVVGRCALHPGVAASRAGLAFGAGMQIAASHFHTYNHALVLTTRWIF